MPLGGEPRGGGLFGEALALQHDERRPAAQPRFPALDRLACRCREQRELGLARARIRNAQRRRQARIGERQSEQVLRRERRQREARGESGAMLRAGVERLEQTAREQACARVEQRAVFAPSRRQQTQREVDRDVAPRHVVVEVGVQRLVAQVDFRRQRAQHDVLLEAGQADARREIDQRRIEPAGAGERLRLSVERADDIAAVARIEQRVDLRIRDIQSAQFVERELVARAQPQHFALDQAVEPREVGRVRVAAADRIGAGQRVHAA